MKALSIRQPWAWLLTSEQKTIETRTWLLNYKGPIAIHAPKQFASNAIHLPVQLLKGQQWQRRGGIVGMCIVKDCRRFHEGDEQQALVPFESGLFSILIEKPITLPILVPCQGQLGLFDLHDNITNQVLEQLQIMHDFVPTTEWKIASHLKGAPLCRRPPRTKQSESFEWLSSSCEEIQTRTQALAEILKAVHSEGSISIPRPL